MKTFMYRGYDQGGLRKKGVIEALDLKDARDRLARTGIFPETVEAATNVRSNKGFINRSGMSLQQTAVRSEFYRAMAALLKAGLPLAAAFEVMIDHPGGGSSAYTQDIAGIRDRIRDGTGFVNALSESSVKVSPFEAAVIESGEKTGHMPDVLDQVADYLDDVGRIQQTLRTACLYPLIIVFLALIVGVGVMGFLVPQMAKVFEESGMELPMITTMVVGVGHWFLPVILPLLILVIISVLYGFRRMMADRQKRIHLEQWISRLPFIKHGFNLLVTTRFSRTCALLLRGGLPLVEAIELSGRATGSVWLAEIVEQKAEAVRHGQSFSQSLSEVPILGVTLPSWIKAGEASGDLAGLFHHASERNRQLWSNYIQRAVTIIEPALIVLVALFVLLVALAILLPILSLNNQLG